MHSGNVNAFRRHMRIIIINSIIIIVVVVIVDIIIFTLPAQASQWSARAGFSRST